jgi:xanthine dehydrogenase/oxidase
MNSFAATLDAPETVSAINFSNDLVFWLNGKKVTIVDPDPAVTLVDYLHSTGLTGTKVGCGQGGCGACTVMLTYREAATGTIVHRAVNACLRPLCAVSGMIVTTTEGIGNVHDGVDPVQYEIAANNGTQCGFCTPGFVMNTHAFLQQNPSATQRQMEDIFGGNLCRCTGYRPILEATRKLACDDHAESDCTMKCEIDPALRVPAKGELAKIRTDVLPPPCIPALPLHFSGSGIEWYRPSSLSQLQELKSQSVERFGRENVKLVFGNTASGVYQNEKPRCMIDISRIAELGQLAEHESGIRVGASVPIQMLMDFVTDVIQRLPEEQTTGLRALNRHAAFIAGYQVRSAGSVAGNIFMTRDHANRGAGFPSDLFTVLSALGTTICIGSREYPGGNASYPLIEMPATESLPADAVIIGFEIPFTRADEFVQTYRIARRPQMSHPIVNAGLRCRVDNNGTITPGEITIIFGGLSSMQFRASRTEQALAGKKLNEDTLRAALEVLKQEVIEHSGQVPEIDEEGISRTYRRSLAEAFFYKFFVHVALAIDAAAVDPENASAATEWERPLSHGTQEFTEYPELFPLSKPIIKRAALVQATGEIKYTQDIPLPTGGVHAAMVISSRPHARFSLTRKAPTIAALEEHLREQFPGFAALVTVADIPTEGNNLIGLGEDDPVFSDGIVTSVGAPIALVAADTFATAREVAAYVEKECVAYEDLPAVLTIDEAIEQNTAMPMVRKSKDPDEDVEQRIPSVTRPGSDCHWLSTPNDPLPNTEVVEGALRTGAQMHFYMETMCALCIPGPYDQMTIYNSTQNPNGNQASVARALGVGTNQITIIVEQIGGGFGAKQHRAQMPAAQAAVAARRLNRPVRLLYDRATDSQMVGKRHPYLGQYHAAFTQEGVIEGMRIDLHSDAGDTYDCSFAVMDLSLMQADGCYNVKNFQANGTVYRTNKTSNTAFRTFGNIQPYVIREDAVEHVAHQLSRKLGREVLPEEIRRKNLYRSATTTDFDQTHHGQDLRFCNIGEIWDKLYKSAEFERRQQEVREFNRKNRWRKRGIAMVPQKYGIAFTEPRGALNASSALVNVNMGDGTITVTHGGVEMGQGLNTKIAQLAANTLGIPLELVRVTGNNSDAVVNAPATAASTGYDLNGGAVEKACRVLRERLENFCRDLEQYTPHDCIEDWRLNWSANWKQIVFRAWFNRINLSAAELYKAPHYQGNSERWAVGHPHFYYCYSAAVTEVEIDVLTGEFVILRADLLYDPGKSPNPAIDIGQIEGGYVQGVGYVTTEETIFNEHGALVTDNVWSYKPPCSKTIPLDFRVKLRPVDEARNALEDRAEMHAVKSSKTVGEPGMTLGITAYFAIKRAMMDARRELTGRDEWLSMDAPATCQRIHMNCGVTTESLNLGAKGAKHATGQKPRAVPTFELDPAICGIASVPLGN